MPRASRQMRLDPTLSDGSPNFHTVDGTGITLTLTRKGRRVDVTVRDHGPGIPDFAGAKVFEKFF